jgi:alpha-glucosidase
MAADLPENYQDHPAFAFIDAVPTDWQQSIALQGKIGEYLVVARQDRHSANWFLGATSNEQARQLTVPLDFLTPGKSYQMIRYQDAADAHWETNPMAYQIDKSIIKAGSTLVLQLQPGGGTAIEFIPQ